MTVPGSVLVRCFWRTLFLQASWNRRGMQNLGFAYAVEPALRVLYPDLGARAAALSRHLGFFNCHPYTAAAIVGGAIHHEERVAAGRERPEGPNAYKSMLQGPLAAIGDGFFWTALRPFFGAVAALGGLLFGWPAIAVALTIYNAIQLAFRIGLFRAGYREGDAVVGAVARLALPLAADRLRVAGAAACGVCAAAVAIRAAALPRPSAVVVAALAATVGYAALARGARLLPTAYAAMIAGIGAALAAGRIHGSL